MFFFLDAGVTIADITTFTLAVAVPASFLLDAPRVYTAFTALIPVYI